MIQVIPSTPRQRLAGSHMQQLEYTLLDAFMSFLSDGSIRPSFSAMHLPKASAVLRSDPSLMGGYVQRA
jgi:hypothetical protein